MDSDQERRTKLIDELTTLDFQACVPNQEEFREFVSSFLDGLGPGPGLIGRPDEYMDLDESVTINSLVEKEEGDDTIGAADSRPIPKNSVAAGNADDSQVLDGLGPSQPDDMDLDESAPTDSPVEKEEGDDKIGAADPRPIPKDSVDTRNANDSQDEEGAAGKAENANDAQDGNGDIKKKKKKPAEPDSESVGAYEDDIDFGGDYVQLPSGEYVGVWEYFGTNWGAMIEELYNVTSVECPPHMTVSPHAYQLKAAAQADWLCEGPFEGILIGDGMGLGKTLMATIAMYLRRTEPGMSLVLCPASLCSQWVATIQRSWSEGHGMTAFHLHDASMSATQLLAAGYDVIVSSYEFAERSYKEFSTYHDDVQEYVNKRDSGCILKMPKRPTSALFSHMWRQLNMPWKRVVLDEVQKINKRNGRRHRAIKEGLYAKAFIMLSGTLPHNKWDDMSGYVDFLKNHPFPTHADFMRTFTKTDYNGFQSSPDAPKLRLLQRFLQAVLIARPVSVLKLKGCIQRAVRYNPDDEEVQDVSKLTRKYKETSVIRAASDGNVAAKPGIDKADSSAGALGIAIYAQMRALHPLLVSNEDKERLLKGSNDDYKVGVEVSLDSDGVLDGATRADWLSTINETADLLAGSSRTQCLVELFKWLRTEHPTRKIVIFSTFLKYLDILDEVLQRELGIIPIRYDGSISVSQRPGIEEAFKTCAPNIPMLITGGAGGVGLNLAHGSVVVQCEAWWNRSTELQAIGRCHRQLQTESVIYIRIQAKASPIDDEVLAVQRKKTTLNEELMRPLIRFHDEGPAHIPLLSFPGLVPLRWEQFQPSNPDFYHASEAIKQNK